MRICDLRKKEVINLCNCRRLGCAVDVEFDLCKRCVESIIVPGPGKLGGFLGMDCEYVIPLECIVKTGPDFIMVEISEEKYRRKCGKSA